MKILLLALTKIMNDETFIDCSSLLVPDINVNGIDRQQHEGKDFRQSMAVSGSPFSLADWPEHYRAVHQVETK